MVKKAIKISTFGLIDIDKKGPALPEEDPAVDVLRQRQVRDLAELDEEENRRLKTAFRTSRGIRAFRRSGGGSGSSSSIGSTGQRAFNRQQLDSGSGRTAR